MAADRRPDLWAAFRGTTGPKRERAVSRPNSVPSPWQWLLLAGLVWASAANGESQSAGSDRVLEEIVVTAQKRTENLQDVPFTVSAVTGADLEKYHVDDLEQLNGVVPNILFAHPPNGSQTLVPTIRGIGITTNPSAYAGTEVAIVVDGVVQGTRRNGLLKNYDVERIEVLKGPQGTLFGADTLGGAVNITTRQPTGEFGAYGKLTAGNYDQQSGFLAINFPIVENELAGKVSFASWDRDGFYTNLFDGEDLMSVDSSEVRGYLLWTPTPGFDATLKFGRQRSRQGGQVVVNRSRPEQILYRSGISDRDIDYDTYSDSPVTNSVDVDYGTLTMNWESPIGLVTSITAYDQAESLGAQDTDGTDEYLLNAGTAADEDQFSQEIRLDATPTTNLQVTVGAYYRELDFQEDVTSVFNSAAGGSVSLQVVRSEEKSAALFGQAYYDVTERFRVGLGLRYSREEVSLESNNEALFNAEPHPFFHERNVQLGTLLSEFSAAGEESWTEPAGKVSAEFELAPAVKLYGYYAHGFKSGGFSGRIAVPEDLGPFEPEYIDSFEVGLKSEYLDQRLRINAAAFYNDWQDMQVPQSVYRGTQTSSTILNAAQATSEGAELSIDFVPAGTMQITANVGYVNATYDDFSNEGVDYAGNEMPFSPHWTGSASISNEWALDYGTVSSALQYTYMGERWGSFTQMSSEQMDSVGLVNANIAWEAPSGQWSVEFWARNLLDENYIASSLSVEPLFTEASYGEPRQYGIDVTFEL